MQSTLWGKRFFETTRGKIVRLLSAATRTVAELASHLGMTENAVRSQLATLERDGLARQSGIRPGFRKPNFAYDLTPQGHQLFPKLYGPVLVQLLDVLSERQGSQQVQLILQQVGERLMRQHLGELSDLPPEQRLARLAQLVEAAGFPLELTQQTDGQTIRGSSCPLAGAVNSHPELCQILAELLSRILQQPVRAQCDCSVAPRCCFNVGPAKSPKS